MLVGVGRAVGRASGAGRRAATAAAAATGVKASRAAAAAMTVEERFVEGMRRRDARRRKRERTLLEGVPEFRGFLREQGLPLARAQATTLQANIGKLCNERCTHCHVEAGPLRTEMMGREVAEHLVRLLKASPAVRTLDLTGGAPELNSQFRFLVREARALGVDVIDRCNLTVLFEKGQEDLGVFLRDHNVQIVASLPCYTKDNVDKQRGSGVFDKSVRGLQLLNRLGYGVLDGLKLDLVYNPGGAFLPGPTEQLEADYKRELAELFDIEFNSLFTLANLPVKRFADHLIATKQYGEYMELLVNSFNPATIDGLMCRHLISVSHDGTIHDCDFNQMLEMPLGAGALNVADLGSLDDLTDKAITTGHHCFGCTAGAGSSCSGALA